MANKEKPSEDFGSLLGAYFDYLTNKRKSSPRTVESYRDTWHLFLAFLVEKKHIKIPNLSIEHINADNLLDFLDYVVEERGCSVRTRNQRLAAIRSFAKYVILHKPERMEQFQRILMVPGHKHVDKVLGYLTKDETQALLDAPNRDLAMGRRDYALLLLMYNSGARVSEVAYFCMDDIKKEDITIHGKGGKDRRMPLWKETVDVLKDLSEERGVAPAEPLFVNAKGEQLTRHGIAYILNKHAKVAAKSCPTIEPDKVSPHVIRHTTAMHLLQSGADINVIRMWLGHVNLKTTNVYVESDIEMKREALQKSGILKGKQYDWTPSGEVGLFMRTHGIV